MFNFTKDIFRVLEFHPVGNYVVPWKPDLFYVQVIRTIFFLFYQYKTLKIYEK